ncbi:MAG: hypothetical protein FD170_3705 [Bacteroidetes bacterium]|nr:MAG: hypothetical protein FD170_3705 [Bacteroidota bacterium]
MKSKSFAPSVLLILIFISCSVSKQNDTDISKLHWISGNYIDTTKNFFEYWTLSGDSQFNGKGYTVKASDTLFMEDLSIKKIEGKWCYIVKTSEVETIFRLNGETGDSLVFENEENDFPKRIIYTRKENKKILASIDNPDDPKSRIDFNLIPQK